MRRLVWIGLALTALGVLVRTEEEKDGAAVIAAPFILARAIECAVFFLKHDQGRLLAKR